MRVSAGVLSWYEVVYKSDPVTRLPLHRVYPHPGLVSHDVEHQSTKASDRGSHAKPTQELSPRDSHTTLHTYTHT